MRDPTSVSAWLAIAFAAAVATGACSFRVVVPPPAPADWPRPVRPGSTPERCTSSVVPPVLDTVATLVLFGAAYVERDWPSHWPPILLGVAGVPTAASGVYGYWVTINCRRYRHLFD